MKLFATHIANYNEKLFYASQSMTSSQSQQQGYHSFNWRTVIENTLNFPTIFFLLLYSISLGYWTDIRCQKSFLNLSQRFIFDLIKRTCTLFKTTIINSQINFQYYLFGFIFDVESALIKKYLFRQ